MSNVRRAIGFAATALISITLPTFVACWSVYSFLTSGFMPFDFAAVRNGQMWFQDCRAKREFAFPPDFQTEIKCRDLTTGIERSLGFAHLNYTNFTPIWLGETLYFAGPEGVYLEDLRFKLSSPLPSKGSKCIEQPVFSYHGELTTVVEDPTGHYRLNHLRDGIWVDGRKIRLPPDHCDWYDNPTDGRKMFRPSEAVSYSGTIVSVPAPIISSSISSRIGVDFSVATTPASMVVPAPPMAALSFTGLSNWQLYVQQLGANVHVFFKNEEGFYAYRAGLEFDDSTDDAISALDAENTIRDANGWEPVPLDHGDVQRMVCDQDGALFSSTSRAVIRRHLSGAWGKIDADPTPQAAFQTLLIVDSTEGIVYLVGKSGKLLRVNGNSVQPTTFTIPDSLQLYFARWQWLLFGLFGAWALHYLLVLAGTSLLTRSTREAAYEFGVDRVTLASYWRRGLAITIDLAILGLSLLLSFWAHLQLLGLKSAQLNHTRIIEVLGELENMLLYDDWQMLMFDAWQLIPDLLTMLLFNAQDDSWSPSVIVMITVLVDTGLVLWFLKVYDEGRHGLSPGKWLLGIRTKRTTLRPCGFARALVRDTLDWVDLCALLTPLPAAASLIFSSNRQRWGDRVADTIVIEKIKSSFPGSFLIHSGGKHLR
jgi:uncharacterized RDD family membrane protein YckC